MLPERTVYNKEKKKRKKNKERQTRAVKQKKT